LQNIFKQFFYSQNSGSPPYKIVENLKNFPSGAGDQYASCAKFNQNRSNGCRDIAIFVILKMAAAAILGFKKFEILTFLWFLRQVLSLEWKLHVDPGIS